jgi:YVTN family beta-propeller protein
MRVGVGGRAAADRGEEAMTESFWVLGKQRLTGGKRPLALPVRCLYIPFVEIRMLGPVEVISDGASVALGGPKQRAFFAVLVLHRDQALPVERLVDLLWGEVSPPTAAKTVHVFVSRLRKALGESVIVTSGSGYRLVVDPDSIDACRFERLLEQGRALRAGGAAADAAGVLREALGQWRGAAAADLVHEQCLQTEIARLEEQRLVAVEERIDADLAVGRADELTAELQALVGEHPLRERLWAQLMLALYRSGRQADALATYQRARATFAEQLGLEPGPALQELERAILAQDPRLGSTHRLPLARGVRHRHRGLALALASAVLIAATAAAAAAVLLEGGHGRASLSGVPPDSLALIDPHADAVVSAVPIGAGPVAVQVGDGSVWVANAGDETLARVDPTSRQIVDRIGLSQIPTQLAFGHNSLWVASAIGDRGVVSRVDPHLRAVVAQQTVRVGFGSTDDRFASATPTAIAASAAGLFTNDMHSGIWRLTSAGRTRTFHLGASHSVDGLAAGAGALWVASGADDRVLRLDPATGRVVATIPVAAVAHARLASPYGIAVGDGAVWVTNALAGTVSRIDPRVNAVAATITVGRRPTRLAVGAGAVWVLNAGDGSVSKIDPARSAVTATIKVGGDLTGINAGAGGVWVTVAGGPPHASRPLSPGPISAISSPGCSALLPAHSGADLVVASDLPTFNPGPSPDPVIADIRAAIRLVLTQRDFRAGRYRIALQSCDDSRPGEGPDPALCASNARAYALDPSLVGVIGTYASFCSGIELPALGTAPSGPVAMISPSNTYAGLTHEGPATAADEPDRYYPAGARNFARLVAADDYQSAGIDLFLKQLGRTRPYVLDDGAGTGYAGATYAKQAAGKLGLTPAGSATWDPTARSYVSLAQRIAATNADAVVLSGCLCSNGAKLVTDLRRVLGNRATLIGTDNFSETAGFIHTHVFDGLYLSTAGLPAPVLPLAGREFLSRLLPHRPLEEVDPNVAYAAQATEILLDAIASSDGTRASITRELLMTATTGGILGRVAFTAHGDPIPAPIAIYRVDSHLKFAAHREAQGELLERVVYPPASALP